MITTTRLPSGMAVVTEQMPHVQWVALSFWVGVGSRDEPSQNAGASHFLEHLLFKGTSTRSAQDIAECIEAVGGEMNAFTAKDHTAFDLRLPASDIELGLDVLCDIMWDPAFRPDEVEAERQVILEEILIEHDEPEDLVHDLLGGALWPAHPLGRDPLGIRETVTAMTVADIQTFHGDYYHPGATVFAAAGNLDHQALVGGIARRVEDRRHQKSHKRPDRAAPTSTPTPLVVHRRKTEQAHLAWGLPAMSRRDPDRHAATLLVHALGGGTSSRLFQEVRERRGLAYSVYAYRSGYEDAGVFGIYAGTAPSRAAETFKVVSGEIERLADGLTDRELEVARGNLIGSLMLGLEDSGSRMHRIGRSLLLHDTVPTVEDIAATFAGVSQDDLRRVGARLLEGPQSLAVIGPFTESQVGRWPARPRR